jgi:hypothetical protein
MTRIFLLTLGIVSLGFTNIIAGEVDVVDAKVAQESGGTFRFSVTLNHADEGWDHYADAWQVLGSDDTVYATRVLAHPHVSEQPFTRSKSGVKIPAGVKSVTLRGHDKVHDYGGKTMDVALPGR